MEEKKSYRAIFKEKMAEVHTREEIKLAFEDSFAACFALAEDRAPGAKTRLFGRIWEINPDAILARKPSPAVLRVLSYNHPIKSGEGTH